MESYLSTRGYGFLKAGNEEFIQELKEKLTVKPFIHPNAIGADKTAGFPVYCESANKLYIPRAYGLKQYGAPTVDQMRHGDDAEGLIFQGTLRQEQEAPVQAFLEAARDPLRRGGIISLQCGGGKTVVGLYIACQLKKKTMVICHKEFLMNQWRERISQFIPTAKVGLIKQNKMDVDGCDIVLASLQSLAMRDYPSNIFKGFHLVIIDEIHHTSAEVFSRALPKISFPVMLGLSATLKRVDGLSKVFEWYVGKPVFISKRKKSSLQVYMLPYDNHEKEYCNEPKMWNGKLIVPQMINNITAFKPRDDYIMNALKFVLENEPNRKTLILSDRRAHLAELEKRVIADRIGTVGYYVGGMKEADLKKSETCDVILGTFTMACIADNTNMVDPISGVERYMYEFADNFKPEADINTEKKLQIPLISMYPSTETVHLSHCANFGYSPQKPCIRIIHELGDITMSKDHKVYTLDGWKPAGELTTSDYLITPRRLDIKSEEISCVDHADLWMIGCVMAERNNNDNIGEDVLPMVQKIMHQSAVARELVSYFHLQLKQQPESFLGIDFMFLPDEKLCSLVGGIFDGAGYVSGYCIYFKLDSVRLCNQLRTLLLRLEIRTTRSSCVKPGYPCYVYVVNEDTIRFRNLMDVRSIHKKELLTNAFTQAYENRDVIEKNKNPPTKSKWLSSVKIYDIKEVDSSKIKLCDIEVKTHHNFVASDIIVHNSEGMDIPALNTLVLASPISSIEQSIGRIQRQKEEERTVKPIVIDIWDQFSLFKTQGFRRLQFYKKNNYEITTKLMRNQESMTDNSTSTSTCTSTSTHSENDENNEITSREQKRFEFIDDDQ